MNDEMKVEDLMKILSDENKAKEEAEEEKTKLPGGSPNDLMIAYLHTQINKLNEEVESLKQDRRQRKTFSEYIFYFMCIYMFISLVAVFLKGFGVIDLSDSVVISLMTTSLASVIGIFNFVAKYLFHPKS